VRRRALAPLLRELQVETDLLRLLHVGALRLDKQPDPGGGVEAHDELVGLRASRALWEEPEPWRLLEHEPQLCDRRRQVLASADEEGHSGPAPVVDLQLQSRV